jgi:hypothetical protein
MLWPVSGTNINEPAQTDNQGGGVEMSLTSKQVTLIYQAVLGRQAKVAEIKSGKAAADGATLANQLFDSSEYGDKVAPVAHLYEQIFDKEPAGKDLVKAVALYKTSLKKLGAEGALTKVATKIFKDPNAADDAQAALANQSEVKQFVNETKAAKANLNIADLEVGGGGQNNITYQLAPASTSVTEGGSVATFTVTASAPVASDTTITINTSGDDLGGTVGKASASDFDLSSGLITIKAGESQATFTLAAKADGVAETAEGVKLSLSGVTANSALITILDTPAQSVENVGTGNNTPFNASTGDIVFAFAPGNYTYNISNFGMGDVLRLPEGSNLSVVNTDGADGVLDISATLNGQQINIHLTDLKVEKDAAIIGVSSFNAAYGQGSLTTSDAVLGVRTQVAVAGANDSPFIANTADNSFNLAAGNYTYNISNFGSGDIINFPAGSNLSVVNTDGTDGVVDVTGTLNGQLITIHLTNLNVDKDATILGVSSFESAFGANSLNVVSTGPASGDIVKVSAGNASPDDASKGDFAYQLAVGNYTYNINNFGKGDSLAFPAGSNLSIVNTDGADGVLDISGTLNGQQVIVHLTGVASAQDGTIIGVNSFNAAFGVGSLA